MLLKPFGSDGPNKPFLNLILAVIHPTPPDEALRMEQGVTACTRGSAYAELRRADAGRGADRDRCG
jgi:predicted amidohydrolase YtcJ